MYRCGPEHDFQDRSMRFGGGGVGSVHCGGGLAPFKHSPMSSLVSNEL